MNVFKKRRVSDNSNLQQAQSNTVNKGLNDAVATWSFEELVDVLDKSNNLELLRACHYELHRRHRAYRIWGNITNTKTPRTESKSFNTTTKPYSEIAPVAGTSRSMPNNVDDLTTWSTQQLETTINTSNNTELLRACRLECQRRCNEYERSLGKIELKAMEDIEKLFLKQNSPANSKNISSPEIPVTSPQNNPIPSQTSPGNASHSYQDQLRCFRVAVSSVETGVRGWWYGEYKGQKLSREMEVIENRPPLLYIQGVHDALMSQVTLDETGLTSRDAGISNQDFQTEWEKYCAPMYMNMY